MLNKFKVGDRVRLDPTKFSKRTIATYGTMRIVSVEIASGKIGDYQVKYKVFSPLLGVDLIFENALISDSQKFSYTLELNVYPK